MTMLKIGHGSTADYCSGGGREHALVHHKPAGTMLWVPRCSLCGWIDGADLEQQLDKATAALRAELESAVTELDEARSVIGATRNSAINAFTDLRRQLLTALGLEDDRRTTLTEYVTMLVGERDGLIGERDELVADRERARRASITAMEVAALNDIDALRAQLEIVICERDNLDEDLKMFSRIIADMQTEVRRLNRMIDGLAGEQL